MKRTQMVIAAAVAALLLIPSGALGLTVTPPPPDDGPTPIAPEPVAPRVLQVEGILGYETNLESPHYVVDGWALMVDGTAPLQRLVGRWVAVTGTRYQGISILMRPQLEVREIRTELRGDLVRVEQGEAVGYQLEGWNLKGDVAALAPLAGQTVLVKGVVVLGEDGAVPTLVVESVAAASAVEGQPGEPELLEVSGILEYETELETPHFAVDGWALMVDSPALLRRLVGRPVTVRGTPYDGVSVLMRRQLQVAELEATLEGRLERLPGVEAAVYVLDGWVLVDADGSLRALEGQWVTITGRVLPQPVMAPIAISVRGAEPPAQPDAWNVPRQVIIDGAVPALPVKPYLEDGHLMLPLRALVEAAGGQVIWHPYLRTIEVKVSGHRLMMAVGQTRVSGGRDLPVPPVIREDRTMVPLELFAYLGYRHRWTDGMLILVPQAEPALQ